MNKNIIQILICAGILLLGSYFRLTGVNWDQNQHLHPDERFLTMVATAISWPKDIGEYLDAQTSPLNPHNKGFGFYVYGTFPLFFTKWVAESLQMGDYTNLTLIGRQLSALVDLGTVLLVFFIAKTIVSNMKSQVSKTKKPTTHNPQPTTIFSLLAMFFYAIMVLPIQLSHFYAVDTYLNFFVTWAFYETVRFITLPETASRKLYYLHALLLGLALGLGIASKISAILILPILLLMVVIFLLKKRKFAITLVSFALCLLSLYLTVRVALPYAFATGNLVDATPNVKYIENLKTLESFDNDKAMFPPAVQWLHTSALLFPLKSLVFWGVGLPLAIASILSLVYLGITSFSTLLASIRKQKLSHVTILSSDKIILLSSVVFLLFVFFYQGVRYTKNMRYFIIMYPQLAIITGYVAAIFIFKIRTLRAYTFIKTFLFILLLIWPFSFIAIYERPHSRIAGSYWIYDNIPSGKTIGYEHWDDPLPLHLPGLTPDRYQFAELTLYDPDVSIKWEKVVAALKKTDYIVMTSNRLWGSIPRAPNRYPISGRYYQALFDGSLGFTKLKEIHSYPCFPSASICLLSIDDTDAEESFTVYDHPKVLVYEKQKLNEALLSSWLEESKKYQ